MGEAQGMDEPHDVTGWPIRVGMRIRVCGHATVLGAPMTSSKTGEVMAVVPSAKHGFVIRFRDDASGSEFHSTIPERVRVRRQTKEEREAMLRKFRRENAKRDEQEKRSRR